MSAVNDSEALIQASLRNLRARRRERFVYVAGKGMRTHMPGEQTIYLPDGHSIKVTTDDSGIATQVEETDRLHAVVRPHTIRIGMRR